MSAVSPGSWPCRCPSFTNKPSETELRWFNLCQRHPYRRRHQRVCWKQRQSYRAGSWPFYSESNYICSGVISCYIRTNTQTGWHMNTWINYTVFQTSIKMSSNNNRNFSRLYSVERLFSEIIVIRYKVLALFISGVFSNKKAHSFLF